MTHLSKLLETELDAFRERTGRNSLKILETGSIRNEGEEYHQNDGWSTLTFAEYVAKYGGSLTSVDLDINAAHAVLTRHGLREHADLAQGHSIEVLSRYVADHQEQDSFDVVLLDSDNDASLIINEFFLAKRLMRHPALVLVDDVEPRSPLVVKGHQIMPWLDLHEVPYRLERRTGDGYSTGVLVFEL